MTDMCDDIPRVSDMTEPWSTITHRIYVDFPDFAGGWRSLLRYYGTANFSHYARSWINSMFSEMAPWSDELIYYYADEAFDLIVAARKWRPSWQASERPGYAGHAYFEWSDKGCDARVPEYEVAWAAGIFDGEGSVTWHKEGKPRIDGSRRMYPRLYVGNTDKGLLERYQGALNMLGHIYGPYGRYDQNDPDREIQPMFHWTATHKQGREAAEILLPFLSSRNAYRVRAAFFPATEGEDE